MEPIEGKNILNFIKVLTNEVKCRKYLAAYTWHEGLFFQNMVVLKHA